MNIALWIAQGLLAMMFLMAGVMKAVNTAKAREQMAWVGRHSVNFVRTVGVFEILGALGLVLPMLAGILPWLTPVAALGLVLVQLLAILAEHIPAKEYTVLPVNLVLLALAIFVAYGRFAGLT